MKVGNQPLNHHRWLPERELPASLLWYIFLHASIFHVLAASLCQQLCLPLSTQQGICSLFHSVFTPLTGLLPLPSL